MTHTLNRTCPITLVAALVMTASVAHAEPRILGVCQDLLGDQTSCAVRTAWSVDKTTSTPEFVAPDGGLAKFTITVTEGETSYSLGIGAVVTLTGLIPEGTQVRGLVVSVQKGNGQGGFTTVASGGFGDTTQSCGCPFVDSGELQVALKTLQGQAIPTVAGSVLEYLAYSEDVRVEVEADYDLSNAIIRPGDPVRLQTCVNYVPDDALDDEGCIGDGGSVRTVKACSPFDFAAYAPPEANAVALSDTLGTPAADFVSLAGFTATTDAAAVDPPGTVALSPWGTPTTWAIPAVGVLGHQTVFEVAGQVSCHEVNGCTSPNGAYCDTTFDNRAKLEPGSGQPAVWSSAAVTVSCVRSECTRAESAACDDGDPCTADVCDPGTGCSHAPLAGPCNDHDACTVSDHCEAGACVGAPRSCDDGNTCTVDACDPTTGCTAAPLDDVACDDDDLCTENERCVAGRCEGATTSCDDGNACTSTACDPHSGCLYAPLDAACDDGSACSDGDWCVDGACQPGLPVDCQDDANPCTAELCDRATGCAHVPLDAIPCEDGDHCTLGDTCVHGACEGQATLTCDDGEACTSDACVPALGCVFAAVGDGLPCDDGNSCTSGDHCQGGTCHGAQEVPCDDDNPCTDEVCDPAQNCQHIPRQGGPCDDGDPCTEGATCAQGECVGGVTATCDDDNPCTDDYCDAVAGCLAIDNLLPCDDGDACTLGDTCGAGACQPGGANPLCCAVGDDAACADADPCTVDLCDGGLCANTPMSCSDGFDCTADRCVGGACVNDPWGPAPATPATLADFEGASALAGWALESDNNDVAWRVDGLNPHSGAASLYCGAVPAYSYDFGTTLATASRTVAVPPGTATLRFWARLSFEENASCIYDVLRVTVDDTELAPLCSSVTPWTQQVYDISAFASRQVRLTFTFDTFDDQANAGGGAWIDDLTLGVVNGLDCCATATDCDDHDPCTTDSCGSNSRCAHVAVPSCP